MNLYFAFTELLMELYKIGDPEPHESMMASLDIIWAPINRPHDLIRLSEVLLVDISGLEVGLYFVHFSAISG